MATKAQHAADYLPLPPYLKSLRDAAGLTQRDLGARLGRPQSWVHNCECGNRRVDVAEFAAWARGCGADPVAALAGFLGAVTGEVAGSSTPAGQGESRGDEPS